MKRPFTILFFFMSLLLTDCAQDNEQKVAEGNTSQNAPTSDSKTDYSKIKLKDRFDNKLVKDTAASITDAQFSPVYIGDKKEEITLIYKTEKVGNRTVNYDKFKRPDPNSIIMSIDTTRTVGSPMGIWEYYKTPEYRKNLIANPVFIENISKDTLDIGSGDILPIIIEAKDKNGVWKPIQREFIYDCGTGLTEFYFAPNQIAVTTMKQFEGTFKTKIRLVFSFSDQKIYSNEIEGYINETQIE